MIRKRLEMSAATKALLKFIAPLTSKEERSAIGAAVKVLSDELSQRFQVFPVELRIEKPPTPNSPPKRRLSVLIFDYDKRRTTEVLLDTEGNLVQKTDLTGFQPAFLKQEIQQARDIAEKDERVAAAIRSRGTFASAFGPHDHGKPGARLVGLRYAAVDRKNIRLLGEAVVDLSDLKLVNFETTQKERD